MRNFASGLVAALALAIPAAATDKSPANYPETFYVSHMELYDSGCVMTVSEGHIAYGLSNGGAFFYGCFNVGQTIQGRFVGNRVEILATDKKGRKKGYKYMIVSQSTF